VVSRRRTSTLVILAICLVLVVLRYAAGLSWGARAAGSLLLATLIIRWGLASLRPMAVGSKNYEPVDVIEPDGLPVYSCDACGTQLVLLRKGNDKAPRHCGEPMRYAVIATEPHGDDVHTVDNTWG
jgi:hypothetical protein